MSRIIALSKDPGVFESAKLKNNIRVFYRNYEPSFGLPKIACAVLVNVGGRDDAKGKEGAAHFFEHMPFRGTTNFPNVRALTQEIEDNGGYINAFTGDETTGYEIIVPSDMAEKGIKRLADMLLRPLLNQPDIETERLIILEELRNRLASVNFFAKQELYKGLLGEHPLITAILGTETSLKSIVKKDLIEFHERYYNATNISLFFTGNFEKDDLLNLCEAHFGSIQSGEATQRKQFAPSKLATNSQTFTPDHYNRSVYMLGRVLPAVTLKEYLNVELFRGILTWGLYSPLYEEIREKRGLAYDLGLFHSQYQDLGVLSLRVATQYHQMEEVDRLVWDNMISILDNQTRFNEVKHMLRQSLLYREYNLENVQREAIDDYLDYGHITPLNDYITQLDSISLDQVKDYMLPFLDQKDFLAIKVNCDTKEKIN